MSKQLPEYPECRACGGHGELAWLTSGGYDSATCTECGGSGYEQPKPGAP